MRKLNKNVMRKLQYGFEAMSNAATAKGDYDDELDENDELDEEDDF